jgi:hypothetical protein
MRKLPLVLFAAAVITFSTGSHCNEMTNPGTMPAITNIDDNPTHAGSVLIFAGTNFDASSTFTLQQDGAVRVTLVNPILATGTPADGIQVDVTIPVGAPLGSYQGCVTTAVGTSCASVPVGVI